MRRMYVQKFFLLVWAILVTASMAFAQRTVKGTVFDASDKSTAPGVNVVVKGTTMGTVTDVNGNFSLVVPQGNSELVVSAVGFVSQMIRLGSTDTYTVSLVSSNLALDEVVVTGYGGTQKRAKVTNSISSVKDETLKSGIHANPAQALSGAVSGLKVTQASGNPGAAPTLILRGGTNLDGSGSPLIMVDGQVRGSLSDINPEDIESMDILKDAGATALYGARANNGVVLITTKRGKAGVSEISVKMRAGLNYMHEPYKFLNAEDYLYWNRIAVQAGANIYQKSDGTWTGSTVMTNLKSTQPYGTGNVYFDPANPTVPLDGNKDGRAIWSPMILTDNLRFLLDKGWKTMKDPVYGDDIIYSEFIRSSTAFTNPALTQDYNISATGGNDKGNYYVGLGYYNQQGLPVKTWYQRINFTFNGDYKIRDWLTSSSSFQFNDAKWYDQPQVGEANYFARMLSAPPTQREYNANGELLLGRGGGDGNPLVTIDKFIRKNNTDKFTIAQSFKFDLAKGLNLKINGTWMFDEGYYESFNKDYLNGANTWVTTRSSSASFDRTLRQTYNAILNYQKVIAKDHNLGALAGVEFYDAYNKGMSASGQGAPTDDFADLQYTSTKEGLRSIDSYHTRERILSFFGRVNYDFKDKYLLAVTARQDGYSKLLGDNRYGLFPGVSGGWVVSKEDFFKPLGSLFSFAKLRASYGLNGNVSGLSAYGVQGSYGSTLYNNQVGYSIGGIATPNLRWERSKTFEVGADLGFLQNRLNAAFSFYNRLTMDKFASIPLPASSGISSISSNNGEMRNRGLEIDLNYKILTEKDLKWSVALNATYNINTIVKLPSNGLERNRQSAYQVYDPKSGSLVWVGGYQEGQRPNDLYAFVAQGIFKSDAEVKAVAATRKDITSGNNGSTGKPLYGPDLWATMTDAQKANGFPIQAGDVNWKDVNGDGIIDNFDMVKIGNTDPKWYGGLNSTLSWKQFTCYIRADYALGFYQYDQILPWFMGDMQGSFNGVKETKDTWTTTNTSAPYPKYIWADQTSKRNYARVSSMFCYESSYLAFREISFSYALSQKLCKKANLKGADVTLSGQNLGYLTKSKLYTPEVSSTSGVNGGYGLPITLILGVNLKF
ncbi:MAG: SusC/RagA family TonB-linked outer membrane protein [Marinilabiliales bacterium]|nr:SusC/RagA family TonB-linked outer membrane protein [Marinilabiliales bacterium]